MTGPFRLPQDAPHGFGGILLDRSRPLRFRLDGRVVQGFAGDTVLSATLAAGIRTAGRIDDTPLALTEAFAPLVAVGRHAGAAATPLPMDRVPAVDGLDCVTLGPEGGAGAQLGGMVGRLLGRFGRSGDALGHRFDAGAGLRSPWLGHAPEAELSADLVVVGAGVAGLAAAAAGAALGKRVVVVERRPLTGGAIHFFGSIEGEDGPDVLLERLTAGLGGKVPAQVLTSTEAFAVGKGAVLAHQLSPESGRIVSRILRIAAPLVVLATGATERLPIFAGNRLPGVTGALAAFRLAREHGVWLGDRVVVSTPVSAAYRLALYAADAGVAIQRIVDTRVGVHSRFIDFCKARGVTLGSGLAVAAAGLDAGGSGELEVEFAVPTGAGAASGPPQRAGLLVAAGSWQPDVGLWLAAGGDTAWDPAAQRVVAVGEIDGVAIAGAAAGWHGNTATIASGRAAALRLLGKPAPAIVEKTVPAAFESPDAGTPAIRRAAPSSPPVRLDHGAALAGVLPGAAGPVLPGPARLDLGDLAALVELGMVDPGEAGAVAAERCASRAPAIDSGWPNVAAPPEPGAIVPAYLAGRFGPAPVLCRLSSPDARPFSVGSLVFRTDKVSDPLVAIGVVVAAPAAGEAGGTALVNDPPGSSDILLFVNETGAPSPARVTSRLVPEGPARTRRTR